MSLGRNIVLNFMSRTWSSILAIALIPVYIKFMGIEAYGLVGVFATMTSVLGLLDLGIGATMTRELARRSVGGDRENSQRDLVRTLEIIYWGLALLAGFLIFFGSTFIANSWIITEKIPTSSIVSAVRLMGISFAFQFPMSLYQGGLMGLQRQLLVNTITIILSTFRGLGAILALWLVAPNIVVFFQWQVIISVVGSIIFFAAMWFSLPKSKRAAKFTLQIINDIWKYAAAISTNALLGIILSQLDKVILSKLLSLKMFGYYSIAATVSSVIWMIIVPYNTALFPSLVQLYEKNDMIQLRRLFHASSQWLSLILFPVSAIIVVFSSQILSLWMNDSEIVNNSYLIVSLLAFGTMLNGIVSLPANCAPAFGWPLLMTYTNLVQAFLVLPLIVYMVYLFQSIGAGIAWIIMNSTYVIFMVPVFFKRYFIEEKIEWYIKDILFPGVVAFSVCIVSWLILPNLDSPVFIFIWIVITGLVSLMATAFSLRIKHKAIKDHIVNLLRI
jgi:O-antigen/teichoic acid export membrane protein